LWIIYLHIDRIVVCFYNVRWAHTMGWVDT
jgi:hypothetical protein